MFHSKKGLTFRVIVIAITALFALFFVVLILSGLAGGAGGKVIKIGSTDYQTPSIYDIITGIGSVGSCYVSPPDKYSNPPPIPLAEGDNNVCWQPPAVYGIKGSDTPQVYYSGFFTCPNGYFVRNIAYDLELPKDVRFDVINKAGGIISELTVTGENTVQHKEDIEKYNLQLVRFQITTPKGKTYFIKTKGEGGVTVNSIECVPAKPDLKPKFNPLQSPPFLVNQQIVLYYGYDNLGYQSEKCDTATIKLKVKNEGGDVVYAPSPYTLPEQCGGGEWSGNPGWTPTASGFYTAEVSVDPGNNIDERDETNNVNTWSIAVAKSVTTLTFDSKSDCSTSIDKFYLKVDDYMNKHGGNRPNSCMPTTGYGKSGTYVITPDKKNYDIETGKDIKSVGFAYIYIWDAGDIVEKSAFSPVPGGDNAKIPMLSPGETYTVKVPRYGDVFICAWRYETKQEYCDDNSGKKTVQVQEID